MGRTLDIGGQQEGRGQEEGKWEGSERRDRRKGKKLTFEIFEKIEQQTLSSHESFEFSSLLVPPTLT